MSRIGTRAVVLVGLALTSGSLSSSSAAQAVIVVDDLAGPGVDFTSLSQAIAAASEGATILVRAGSYHPASIEAKSLAITADPAGAVVDIDGSLVVRFLSSGQFVSLAGLTMGGNSNDGTAPSPALSIEDNLGHVWVERCKMHGANFFSGVPSSEHGAAVANSAHVVFVGCDVSGGPGNILSGEGASGMSVEASGVRVFDSQVTGGANQCGIPPCSFTGSASGITLQGGTLFLEGSEIKAGYAGEVCFGPPPDFCIPKPTGPALRLLSGDPTAYVFDSTLSSPTIQVDSGSASVLPGISRDFTITSPAHVGQSIALGFTGTAGDQVLLLVGLAPADVLKPALDGPLLVGAPSSLFALGSLPGSGALTLHSTAPSFAPAFESVALVMQAAFAPAGGGAVLSDPARLVLLNTGF